jgi:hypothetical protein
MPITPTSGLIVLMALVLIATGVLALPLIRYLQTGWSAKRADIMDALSAKSRLRYFEMFDRTHRQSEDTAVVALNRFYIRWYGRRLYLSSFCMLLAVAGITTYLSISTALALYVDSALQINVFHRFAWIPVQPLGIAALSGAYMWVVNDFTSRARRLDFAPSDVHWGVLRLAIALPLGCFVSQLIPGDAWRSFVAFGIGAFPLSGLLSIFRRMLLIRFGMKDNVSTDNDIIKLQGINAEIAERLANEDVTTITQLAYCDPIRLTMRSSLSFSFITDCMSQALAWGYLESNMNIIRSFGLRGAVEIGHLSEQLNSDDADEKKSADDVLNCLAVALKQDKATLTMVFFEIAYDPFTEYLSSIWESPKAARQTSPHVWQRANQRKLARGVKQNPPRAAEADASNP